ncbi:serine protease [Bradyrhizobium barranii subsp. apii]|uniref:Serine protease n=1 Tax=Bradyrhizobium barranii subsp. apii TaxID=2819348 RepID=A0A8T5VQM0_9BRAD|nr:serine protease [Bradyrhizobium barranii]UPT88421.1 serine protease [Bradyrhizobium barranii subsp. apii]
MLEVDLKPARTFSPGELEQVTEAIVESFDLGELTRALRFKWGMVLANFVNTQQGFYGAVGELVAWTERRKKTVELVALACAERPDHATLCQLAQACGLSVPAIEQKYDLSKPLPPKPAGLEAMVARHSRLVDYARFLSRFMSFGDRVCRIETPYMLGTGFLVASDLVLTNFHVVEEVIHTPSQGEQVVCSFDYRSGSNLEESAPKKKSGKHKKARPTVCQLASQWLVAKSSYAKSDIGEPGEAGAGELDYALLRLAEPIGKTPGMNAEERGWFSLAPEGALLAVRDFVVVPQHPDGETLSVAWGNVLAFNSTATRVRYDAITDNGSSGSPCFTADLDIFGLHHATDTANRPTFNQAVPLNLIAADLKAKNIAIH